MKIKATISLDEELYDQAKKYAKETGRSFSGLICVCLIKELKRGEENGQDKNDTD